MGQDSSKADAANLSALSGLSTAEKQNVQNLFAGLTSGSKGKLTEGKLTEGKLTEGKLTEEKLQEHLAKKLPPSWVSTLYREMDPKSQGYAVEYLFYRSVAWLVAGTVDQRVRIIQNLASTNRDTELSAKDIYTFVKEMLTSYCAVLRQHNESDIIKLVGVSAGPSDTEIDMLALLSLHDLFHPDKKNRLTLDAAAAVPDAVYTADELVKWISHTQLFICTFTYLFQQAFSICETPEKPLLPMVFGKSARDDHTNLLNLAGITAINQAIPLKLREKWTLLFDSRKHGESFANLLRNVREHKNTVLLVKDAAGHVFGGFSTAVWSNHPAFQGSIDNFLFSLHPTMDIHRPTGLNTHYFYLNTGQETFPNGMGMGGQFDYFGLWLDCEYGIGHSMAKPLSTTYHNPTLSHTPEFTYTDVEVWKASNIQEDIEEAEALAEKEGVTSILDSDPGAKAILDLIGKGSHSDGLRESDPTASNPEETTAPVL